MSTLYLRLPSSIRDGLDSPHSTDFFRPYRYSQPLSSCSLGHRRVGLAERKPCFTYNRDGPSLSVISFVSSLRLRSIDYSSRRVLDETPLSPSPVIPRPRFARMAARGCPLVLWRAFWEGIFRSQLGFTTHCRDMGHDENHSCGDRDGHLGHRVWCVVLWSLDDHQCRCVRGNPDGGFGGDLQDIFKGSLRHCINSRHTVVDITLNT